MCLSLEAAPPPAEPSEGTAAPADTLTAALKEPEPVDSDNLHPDSWATDPMI